MLNTLDIYRECGKRAAVALNERDNGRYDHEHGWFRRALALESPENRLAAREAYDAAYKEHRVMPTPRPFD